MISQLLENIELMQKLIGKIQNINLVLYIIFTKQLFIIFALELA